MTAIFDDAREHTHVTIGAPVFFFLCQEGLTGREGGITEINAANSTQNSDGQDNR